MVHKVLIATIQVAHCLSVTTEFFFIVKYYQGKWGSRVGESKVGRGGRRDERMLVGESGCPVVVDDVKDS